jgi:hypothetical protein
MKELMDNPYAWLLLSLCTIISFVFAIYTWIVGRKIKEISMDYISNDIITQGKNPIPKLDINFDGKTIEDLTATTFYIWNSGNDVINCEDVVGKKMKIKCKSEAVLDAQIIKQSDDSNNFSVDGFTATDINLIFDYIDGGEGVRIQVLHTGSSNDLSVSCKIKGGKPVRNYTELKKNKGLSGFWRECLNEILPLLILSLGYYGTIMALQLLGLSYKGHELLVLFLSVVVMVLILVMYFKMKKKIERALHRTIPKVLKQSL